MYAPAVLLCGFYESASRMFKLGSLAQSFWGLAGFRTHLSRRVRPAAQRSIHPDGVLC